MRAVVYDQPRRFVVRDVPAPIPDVGEVLVRVGQSGVCGTDLHIDQGDYDARYPLTPGHELVGWVEQLGAEVEGFAVEPLSCAMHGLEMLQPRPGSTALVFGAGPTGTLLAQLLVHGGALHVTVADSSDAKLRRASILGVDATVLVDRTDPDPSTRELRDIAPDGFDIVVEAAGSVAVAERSVPLTRAGGTGTDLRGDRSR